MFHLFHCRFSFNVWNVRSQKFKTYRVFCKSTITNYTVYDWLKQSCITKVFYKDNADLSNDDMNVDADGDGNVEYLFPEKLWNHIYHNLHCCFHCYTLSFLVSPLHSL